MPQGELDSRPTAYHNNAVFLMEAISLQVRYPIEISAIALVDPPTTSTSPSKDET